MIITLVLLCIPAILIPLWFKYRYQATITGLELAANIAVAVLVVAAVLYGGRWSEMMDREIRNGEIRSKERVRVSCEHSYPCRCRTDSKGYTECDTCYRHFWDVTWMVYTNVGDFAIARIDEQGVGEPPRWSLVERGQPVALEYPYTNYIRAARDSIFHHFDGEEQYRHLIPAYPRVYDYHYADRLITVGVAVEDVKAWNARLSELLKTLGPGQQANVVVVVTNQPPEFARALENAWLGGKKNDIVVVVGTQQWPSVSWVHVFSWAENDIINVSLRNDLLDVKTLTLDGLSSILVGNVQKHYVRKPMEEFEYLLDDIDPPMWSVILGLLLATLGSGGLAWVFHRNDAFGNQHTSSFYSSQFRNYRR